MVTEALFGSGFFPFLRIPRNDFDVVTARNNRRLSCDDVLFRNQDEIRHLLYSLSDVRVQFPIKAPGVRALCGIGPVLSARRYGGVQPPEEAGHHWRNRWP